MIGSQIKHHRHGFVFEKGPSIKDVRNQGEGVCLVRTFSDNRGGVLQMRMSALFGAKNSKFFEILCPHGPGGGGGGGGGEKGGNFKKKGGGGLEFLAICTDVFIDGP